MTALACALAYLGSLAFAGWLYSMRRNGPPSVQEQILNVSAVANAAYDRAQEARGEVKATTEEVGKMRVDLSAVAFKLGMGNRAERPQ